MFVPLKLEEVIWECTLKCNGNCDYCGSKDVLRSSNPSAGTTRKIAQQIADYGVKICTLSGGEPGCLPTAQLDEIIEILTNGDVDVRIVTNGLVLNNRTLYGNLDLVTTIGLSINELGQGLWLDHLGSIRDRVTIVTNFGTHNIWEFDKIAKIAGQFNCWQVQLTMGKFMLPPDGISHLREKIRELPSNVRYILSDNLQDVHECSAGISSCGITADGQIVGCLSERATYPEGGAYIVGTISDKQSLCDIWETGFREIRFRGNPRSCRDCIKYPECDTKTPTRRQKPILDVPGTPCIPYIPYEPYIPDEPRIVMYGTGDDFERTTVYGVRPWTSRPRTIVYGTRTTYTSGTGP